MRAVLIAACAVVALAGLGAVVVVPRMAAQTGSAGLQIGGPFALLDGGGKTVTDRDFRGRYMLVYFGYTHCPDVCPTTLTDMAAALDILPAKERARIAPIFITVDPERDTPSVMGDYAHAFGPSFVGLTGSAAAIASVEQAYRVYAAKHPLAHGDYGMDHSSVLYVMGPDGHFLGVMDDGSKPAEMAQRLLAFGA
jgi:protein SCO1/2